jgi:polysaccharide export outer membrane protein
MKKLLYITVFLIFLLPINPMNTINPTNSINLINSVWAQSSKEQPSPSQIDPAPDTPTITQHPSQILSLEIPTDYVIGKGDVLRVFVWRNEQLSNQVIVRPDGKISLPLLQDLQAAGLTVLQLQKEIMRGFSEYLERPKVTVIVNEINSYKVSVLGEVMKPGVYPVTGATTLVEAISMAGGFAEWANKRKITVITHQDGKKKTIKINYKKIASGKNLDQNIILKRGDVIIVTQ